MSTKQSDLERNRHSMAHILAQAVIRLYPETKIGLGPVVGEYFYYDFEADKKITEDDFERIEQEMWSIIKANYPMAQIIVSREEAYNILLHQGQIYKTEILEEISDEEISLYKTGEEFIDLDSGPHVASTAHVGFFKLVRLEDVHWKAKPDRPQMQRIWGVGFLTEKELNQFLEKQEKLRENDHIKIGPKLDYFYFSKNSGIDAPVWLPKGVTLLNTLKTFITTEKKKNGFMEVATPLIMSSKSELLETFGTHAKEMLFPEVSDDSMRLVLRSEISPQHYEIFNSKTRSYRDLPFRIFEDSLVFRKELDKTFRGLTRSRIFHSERSNIFCNEDQVFNEVIILTRMALNIIEKLGFEDYKIQLTTSSSVNDKRYEWADHVLRKVIEHMKLFTRELDDKSTDNGPKLEIFVKDIFDKEWQISSIQLDIFSTVKQNLQYIDANNTPREVISIHTTFIGSYERLIALLIEKYGGNLPLSISPLQVTILPISKIYNEYAQTVLEQLEKEGIRAEINEEDETLQNKIRESQEDKIPFMLIVGSKEESSKSVSVRPREEVDLGLMKMSEFVDLFKKDLTKY